MKLSINNVDTKIALAQQQYPQLTRLQEDFDLEVIETVQRFSRRFVLKSARHQQVDQRELTPSFESLSALEKHTSSKMMDIVEDYLFHEVVEATLRDIRSHISAAA